MKAPVIFHHAIAPCRAARNAAALLPQAGKHATPQPGARDNAAPPRRTANGATARVPVESCPQQDVHASARPPSAPRNRESGYALLFVLVMAAIVAITLYAELPRAAFEAQRDKEQLLVDRGEQYSRAVMLFVHKFNRFPTTMEELENTNNIRSLRRRYADPMTGKQDWRILHAGPGGVITDSVTSAKKTDASAPQNFIADLGMFGNTNASDAEGVNLATRFRPSDQAGASGGDPLATSAAGSNPGASAAPSTSAYSGPVMVLPDGRIVPASTDPAALGQAGGSTSPATFGVAPSTGPGGVLPTGVAFQQNGQNTPPLPPQVGGPPSTAANLINQILTTPRPGGLNGLQGVPGSPAGGFAPPNNASNPSNSTSAPSTTQQQVIGAGLAGVASKKEQEGIKNYNSHTKYNEWEFVYDITKDPKLGRGAAGATGGQGVPGAPGQQVQGPTMPTMGGPRPGQGPAFGTTPGR